MLHLTAVKSAEHNLCQLNEMRGTRKNSTPGKQKKNI